MMKNWILALFALALALGLNACASQSSKVTAQPSSALSANHELAIASQPMHVFLGRVLKIDAAGVSTSGSPLSVTYAEGCTEHFEALVTRDLPSTDPLKERHVAVGAVMSGSKCLDCRCPASTGQALLNFTQTDVAHSFDIITPGGEGRGGENQEGENQDELHPAQIVYIAQEPADEDQLNVTVTYLEKCSETLIDVVPVEVAPIGGYHRNVAVLALVQKNHVPCSMPSHPKTKYFKYPVNVGGYHFLPID